MRRTGWTPPRRHMTAAALLAALALLVAACGGGDDAGGQSASGSAAKSADGLKLGLVLHVRIPFTQQIADGAQAGAEQYGVDLQVAGPQGFDPPAQVKAVQDTIAAGAKGIATVPFPADLWKRPIELAQDQGVPIVSLNVAALDTASPVYVGENSLELGGRLAELALTELGADAKGDVVVGICAPGTFPLELRMQGIRNVFAAKAPGVTVKGPFNVTGDPSTNFSNWRSIVQANPDAIAFLGICAQDLPNLSKIKAKDRDADYTIAGVDLEPEALRGIKDGVALGTVGQNPYLQGYVPIRLLVENLAFDKPMPKGWINSGTEVVTSENIDEVMQREASKEATEAFYKPTIERIFSDPKRQTRPFGDLLKSGS